MKSAPEGETHVRRTGTIVVGNFNLHAGVDGWGRPFDVIDACRRIDADVLMLEEAWTPDGQTGLAAQVGSVLGYSVIEHTLASGRRAGPHPDADHRWMRPLDWRGAGHAIYLDSERPLTKAAQSSRFAEAQPGQWGIAILSRLPTANHQVLALGRPQRDRVQRAVMVVEIQCGDDVIVVAGTHMTHLSYGSPRYFMRLGSLLEEVVGDRPAVLAGDMNLWGPPLRALLPKWQRALQGPTWPAWRPHSQVDHILIRGGLHVVEADVLPMSGSDHRPIRVSLSLPS